MEAFREKFAGVLQEEKGWWAAVYVPEKEEEKREPTEKPERNTEGAGKTEKRDMDPKIDRKASEPAGKKKEQPSIALAQKSEKKTESQVKKKTEVAKTEAPSRQQEEQQIPGQDNVMNHPELLPEGMQTTTATINGHEQEATVEPTAAQRVEECLSLLSCIQGNLALQNYPPALQQAQKLVEHLEALI